MINDIFSNEQTKIIQEEIGILIEQLKLLGWKDIKSWNEFFSIFKPPSNNYKEIEERIISNFLFYRSNYLIIIIIIFLLRIILAPLLFLCILICFIISYSIIYIIKGTIIIGEYKINHTMKVISCSIFSFFFLGLCGALEHLLWGLLISLTIIILHMLFKPRNISSTSNKAYEEFIISSSHWFDSLTNNTSSKSNDYDYGTSDDTDVESSSKFGNNSNESDFSLDSTRDGLGSSSFPSSTSTSMRKRKS